MIKDTKAFVRGQQDESRGIFRLEIAQNPDEYESYLQGREYYKKKQAKPAKEEKLGLLNSPLNVVVAEENVGYSHLTDINFYEE